MPAVLHYDDERALDPDSSGIGRDGLDSRPGPNLADLFNPPLFQSAHHNDAASSEPSSESDTETIELAALRSARAQPSVIPSGGRFDVEASASSYGSSASKDGEGMRPRSAVPSYLDPADTPLAGASQDLHAPEAWPITDPANPPLEQEVLEQAQGPPPTPMSSRQTRLPHRIYVPAGSHRDSDPKLIDGEVDHASLSSREVSAHHSLEIEHTSPIETDSLLPLPRKNDSQTNLLPLPATAMRSGNEADEPRTFSFSFSRLETSFHVVGVLITLFLIIFSVWLTLAKIKM